MFKTKRNIMIEQIIAKKALEVAKKVSNSSYFKAVVDRVFGFRFSKWISEQKIMTKIVEDEYEKAKEQGIVGYPYISYLRGTTNLLNTAVKTVKYIDQDKENDIKMDNDFFWNTIEHSKTISNDEVQELIAKILAGEYNKPGAYSMCTLQILKMIGKSEIDLLEKMGSLIINKDIIPQNLFSKYDEKLKFLLNQKLQD